MAFIELANVINRSKDTYNRVLPLCFYEGPIGQMWISNKADREFIVITNIQPITFFS